VPCRSLDPFAVGSTPSKQREKDVDQGTPALSNWRFGIRMPHMFRNLKSIAAAALLVSAAAGLLALISGPGYRIGLFSVPTAFGVLRWGVYLGLLGLLLSGVALWRARRRSAVGAMALVLAIVVVGVPLRFYRLARSVPPIHDITTDTANPPEFDAVVALRKDAPNSLEYSQEVARQQREAYPDIKPLVLETPAAQVFDRALRAARDQGWEIVAVNADSWRIEATDTTTFFGFKDDVVVRLTPIGSRTVVDVRSVSRLGRSDVGTNARRIRGYLAALSS
jgi:uncharacterized protein (DUF1499 family)